MPQFSNGSLLLGLVLCLFGVLFTWYAADQYRHQLLSDSHRLVRGLALRYLQTLVILTALFGIGLVMSFVMLVTNLFREPDSASAVEAAPIEATLTPTADPLNPIQTMSPTPTARIPLATATLIAPETDPTLSSAQTAVVGGTNGLGVNLRDDPGLESNVIGIIPDGMPVTLIGESEFMDGLTWVAVISPNGDRGWVTDLFLDFNP